MTVLIDSDSRFTALTYSIKNQIFCINSPVFGTHPSKIQLVCFNYGLVKKTTPDSIIKTAVFALTKYFLKAH